MWTITTIICNLQFMHPLFVYFWLKTSSCCRCMRRCARARWLRAVKTECLLRTCGPVGDHSRPHRCFHCCLYVLSFELALLIVAQCCFSPTRACTHTDSDLQFRNLWRFDWYKTQQRWDFQRWTIWERQQRPRQALRGSTGSTLCPIPFVLFSPLTAQSGHFDGSARS